MRIYFGKYTFGLISEGEESESCSVYSWNMYGIGGRSGVYSWFIGFSRSVEGIE